LDLQKLRRDLRAARADEIARRYLVLNAFDGVLATLGIVLGAFFAGTADVRVILIAGLGASTAMGISGAWGAYFTERAERMKSIRELEREMFTSLRDSTIEQASHTAVVFISLIDGLSPLITSVVCLSPLFFSLLGALSLPTGVYLSFAIAMSVLFALGTFLARISETNLWLHGGSMLLAGLAVFLFVYLLGVG
jgi:predicted membrane protein (TIGR00267 family)